MIDKLSTLRWHAFKHPYAFDTLLGCLSLYLCSEFVLDIGRLKEISTTFRNSMKVALNFIVNINQMRNNHESTYFNPIGHFLQIFGILKN